MSKVTRGDEMGISLFLKKKSVISRYYWPLQLEMGISHYPQDAPDCTK